MTTSAAVGSGSSTAATWSPTTTAAAAAAALVLLADAHDRLEPAADCGERLAGDHVVALAEQPAALGVADLDERAPQLAQDGGRHAAGVGPALLPVRILRAVPHGRAREELLGRGEHRERRQDEHRHPVELGRRRGELAQVADRLGVAEEHLEARADQRPAGHAISRSDGLGLRAGDDQVDAGLLDRLGERSLRPGRGHEPVDRAQIGEERERHLVELRVVGEQDDLGGRGDHRLLDRDLLERGIAQSVDGNAGRGDERLVGPESRRACGRRCRRPCRACCGGTRRR